MNTYIIVSGLAILSFLIIMSLLCTEYQQKGWAGRGILVFIVGLYTMIFFVVQSLAWYEHKQRELKTYVPPTYEPVQEQLYRITPTK